MLIIRRMKMKISNLKGIKQIYLLKIDTKQQN